MTVRLQTELLSGFFGDCPVLEVPGRVFPVQDIYLEDVLKLTSSSSRLGGSNGDSEVESDTKGEVESTMVPHQGGKAAKKKARAELEAKKAREALEANKEREALEARLAVVDYALILELLAYICKHEPAISGNDLSEQHVRQVRAPASAVSDGDNVMPLE
jgi:hypothetical protein